MGDFAQLWLQLILVALGIYFILVPRFILCELRRQGKARQEEAAQIIGLLIRMSNPSDDSGCKFQGEAAKLQAIADLRSGADA